MSRLVAFGCSYTYGVGLPDCYKSQTRPSEFSWPSLVSSKLNIPVVNMGKSGAGNSIILDRVLRYPFETDDICIILWSHFIRYDFLKIIDDYDAVLDWHSIKDAEILDKQLDNAYKNYIAMHHCSLYLDSLNVKSIAAIAFVPDRYSFPKPKFLDIKNLIDLPDNYVVDKADDCTHPGIKSQEIIASTLLNGLTNVIR